VHESSDTDFYPLASQSPKEKEKKENRYNPLSNTARAPSWFGVLCKAVSAL